MPSIRAVTVYVLDRVDTAVRSICSPSALLYFFFFFFLGEGSSGVFWTFTKWGVVAAAVGYCFYYDKKRRSAPGFKDAHRLKRKAERVAKEKEDKAALAKKKAAAQQMAAAMMGGGQAPPQQQQKPPKAMIVKQAEQYCTQGVALIDGADQGTTEGTDCRDAIFRAMHTLQDIAVVCVPLYLHVFLCWGALLELAEHLAVELAEH